MHYLFKILNICVCNIHTPMYITKCVWRILGRHSSQVVKVMAITLFWQMKRFIFLFLHVPYKIPLINKYFFYKCPVFLILSPYQRSQSQKSFKKGEGNYHLWSFKEVSTSLLRISQVFPLGSPARAWERNLYRMRLPQGSFTQCLRWFFSNSVSTPVTWERG